MNWRAFFVAMFVLASWQLVGCGPEKADEYQEAPERADEYQEAPEIESPTDSDREVGPMSVSENQFCIGSSTHTVDTANNIIRWTFYTDNTSNYSKKQALVIGRVFHEPSGLYLECNNNTNVSYNSCEITTPIGSGYVRSTGQHRCCIKKGWFGSFVCVETTSGDKL